MSVAPFRARGGLRAAIVLCVPAACGLVACGGRSQPNSTPPRDVSTTQAAASASRGVTPGRDTVAIRRRPRPSYPRLLPAATGSSLSNFRPAVSVRGHTAAWITRRSNVALLSFDQNLVGLRLHSGTIDAGGAGWRYGPAPRGAERRQLVAAFNGGFKLDIGAGGFQSYGRVASPLAVGLGSIVTYADGSSDIGAWHQGVPARGKKVVSVRQNLHLLIDGGRAAADLGCLSCWGATLGGVVAPARSALGITRDRHLIWAGGEDLTVQDLADSLLRARVVRAVELDINPEWVAAYLYGHRGGKGAPAPVAIVPGQPGVPGQFLAPYSRDFFTIVAR